MRVIQFVKIVVIIGWFCLLSGCNSDSEKEFTYTSRLVIPVGEDNDIFCFLTPDGEKDNFFLVESGKGEPVSLKIYTRQGVLVFSIEAKLCAWDGCSLSGQPMASGAYYYTAEVRDSSPKISEHGFVHLYR